jgi:hypothetical protein
MHARVQNGDNADDVTAQLPPVDKVLLVSAEVAIDTKLRRDRPPYDAPIRDCVETGKEAANVTFCLRLAPSISRVPENLIDPVARAREHAVLFHVSAVCCAR